MNERKELEQQRLERDALDLAVDLFAELPDHADAEAFMRKTLKAFSGLRKLDRSRHEEINAGVESDDDKIYLSLDARSIIATAFWFVTENIGEHVEQDEISPLSSAGERICGLINACIALNAASNLQVVIDEVGEQWGAECADMVIDLMPSKLENGAADL